MKCQDVQALLDDYLDGILNSIQVESITTHCAQCDDCSAVLAQARQFRQLLCSSSVPPPSPGFVDRALRHAAQQAGPTHHDFHKQGFIKGFGSAIAAGLALWAVVSVFPTQQTTETPTPVASNAQTESADNAIGISLYEATHIKLAFHAAQAVEGATITISLSDNLELVGYQNRHTLEWKTNLLAGDNVLTLPIKALKLQQGKIIAQVTHNNLMKSIELNLDVKSNTDIKKPVSKNYIIAAPVA